MIENKLKLSLITVIKIYTILLSMGVIFVAICLPAGITVWLTTEFLMNVILIIVINALLLPLNLYIGYWLADFVEPVVHKLMKVFEKEN